MPGDQYDSVRRLPLVAVLSFLGVAEEWKVRKDGAERFGRCPLHEAKKNQTSFAFDSEGKFHCFSCGAKGKGAIDLTIALRKIGFRDAVELLQGYVSSPQYLEAAKAPQVRQPTSDLPTENQPFSSTYEKFQVDSAWLKQRGISPATLKQFEVFEYRNDKRRSAYNGSVMLKIRRYNDGECVGYLSRNIGEVSAEKPKYRFPPNFQKSLEVFGAFQLKEKRPVRVLWLVESPFAVLTLHQKGVAAVSPFGWSLSDKQIEIISDLAKGVLYIPDRDKRQEASPFAAKLSQYCWVKVPPLPAGCDDPELLSAEQIRAMS